MLGAVFAWSLSRTARAAVRVHRGATAVSTLGHVPAAARRRGGRRSSARRRRGALKSFSRRGAALGQLLIACALLLVGAGILEGYVFAQAALCAVGTQRDRREFTGCSWSHCCAGSLFWPARHAGQCRKAPLHAPASGRSASYLANTACSSASAGTATPAREPLAEQGCAAAPPPCSAAAARSRVRPHAPRRGQNRRISALCTPVSPAGAAGSAAARH